MTVTYIRYWGSYFKHEMARNVFGEIMRSIKEAGWKSYLVCSQPPADPKLLDMVLDASTEIIYMPREQENFDITCMWRVYRLCRRLNCTILHCDNMHTSPLIGSALAGVPVRLWSKRSMNSAFEVVRKMTLRDRAAISLRVSSWLATRILPVSNAVKNELVSMGISPSKIIVCPNPVEGSLIKGEIRNQSRKELGYKKEEIVFSIIGHAVPVKGWDILLRAFVSVIAECPRARLLFIGSVTGRHEQEHYTNLQNLIQERNLSSYVHFLGHQIDPRKTLAASDVFVWPSRSEGFGIGLVQAMMSGLPCVATKVGIAEDIIQNGVNGLLVNRGSEEQLCEAMIKLAQNSKLRLKIANEVQAKEKYVPTYSEHGDQLVKICMDLLKTNRSRIHLGIHESFR